MRLTLLKMVQLILSAADSDEVNSISDTTESMQAVDTIESVYYDIIATADMPDHWDLFELQPSGDPSKPTLMVSPENVGKIEWIQYDISESGATTANFRPIRPLSRGEFFLRMNGLDTNNADVYQYDYIVDTGTFNVRGKNNDFPNFYTTTDDNRIIFDNYRADIDTTLVGNKTKAYGMLIPEFLREDDFVPDLAPRQFTLLFNEAKSQFFIDIKQMENGKAEQKARRGWNMIHRKDPKVPKGEIWDTFVTRYGRHR